MTGTNVTTDLFYDLVSVQYHALKGQEVYAKYIEDAQGQQEIVQFFEQVRQQDIQRAETCHRLLAQLSGTGTGTGTGGMGGGTAEPYPTDQQNVGQGSMAGTGGTTS
ncbi:MAG TPA: hypothetical protein VNA20_09545 [Frankiaceae bacterium]|nr:hypothetical protein [Frankiaceae bacterium]